MQTNGLNSQNETADHFLTVRNLKAAMVDNNVNMRESVGNFTEKNRLGTAQMDD